MVTSQNLSLSSRPPFPTPFTKYEFKTLNSLRKTEDVPPVKPPSRLTFRPLVNP